MDTQQVRNIKRNGTWLAAGLMMLSVGLMLLGWTVPRKVAFEAGVFGFQLFPIAVLAVLIRTALPFALNTWLERALYRIANPVVITIAAICGWLAGRWFRPSVQHPLTAEIPEQKDKDRDITFYDYQTFFHYPATGRNPMGNPIDESDPMTNPKLQIVDYDSVISGDDT